MALEDKTEAPTPRRRQEAREDGQVARSVELNAALILTVALIIIRYTGPTLGQRLQNAIVYSLTHFPNGDLTQERVSAELVRLLLEVGTALAPLLLGVVVVALVSNALQVGLVFSTKALAVKGNRLNPLPGIARMFSARAAVELVKSLMKIAIVGMIIYSFLKQNYPVIASLTGGSYLTASTELGKLTYGLLLRASVAMFVIAALDYMYQRFQHEKQLRMTKQEVKDDLKRSEGDPLIKSRIKQKQREIARGRMMQEVPKADVVITNPTHYAVALKYDAAVASAPVVVAKGKNLIAQKIREIAEANNIPIVENVQLARTLYASVEIGDEIPADLYQAVAEILAYVYKLSGKVASSR